MMAVEPMSKRRVSTGMGGNGHSERITALEKRTEEIQTSLDTLVTTVDSAAANTANILALMTHAKSVGGFVRRHGPRVVAFAVGALVMTGKISNETGKSFLHLLGL